MVLLHGATAGPPLFAYAIWLPWQTNLLAWKRMKLLVALGRMHQPCQLQMSHKKLYYV